MATFNIQLPNVRHLDWNDRRTQNMLLDFFNELTEKLNYTLNNMDLTNFDRTTYIDLSRSTSYKDPEQLLEKLSDAEKEEREELRNELERLIWTTANNIETTYDAKFLQSDEMLSSVYESVTEATGEYGTLAKALSTRFEQTSDSITAVAKSVQTVEASANKNLEDYKNEVAQYLTFDTTGLTLSKENSPFKTVLTEQKLTFKQGSEDVAWISDNELHIKNANTQQMSANNITIVNTLRIGNFVWKPESNGSMSLVFDEMTQE